MMTIRCRSRFSALLFCLPLGLCFAGTAWAGSNDDEEEWHDTKGPRSGGGSSDDSDSDKKSDEDSESASKKDSDDKDSDDKDSDDKDSEAKAKGKKKVKASTDSGPSGTKASFALLGSYGLADPQGPGIALRGGAHINGVLPLYVGGIAEYFFGTKTSVKNFGSTSTQEYRFMYFGAEAGVNVEAATDLLIRPYFGLGLGLNTDEHCSESSGCEGGTKIRVAMTPGIVGLYQMGSFFLGPDVRYIIVPGGASASGVTFSLSLGLNL